MFETEAEIRQLQEMLDAHLARANQHMTNIVTPERRLTARQVVTYLQGTKHVAFATVTSKGEPRVSPLDALLRVMVAGHREFHSLMDAHPDFRMQILEGLASRVRALQDDEIH